MTVAADTREAVREHPFLQTALRAGVVNYTAAARFLDDRAGGHAGDREAVAAALRRYVEDLDDYAPPDRRASVSMRSGVGRAEPPDEEPPDAGTAPDEEPPDAGTAPGEESPNAGTAPDEEPLLAVGDAGFTAGGGDLTAVVAAGEVDASALADVLARLRTAAVDVEAAAGTEGTLVVVVGRRAGADAVRAVEDAL